MGLHIFDELDFKHKSRLNVGDLLCVYDVIEYNHKIQPFSDEDRESLVEYEDYYFEITKIYPQTPDRNVDFIVDTKLITK